jgi:hypothetical protein
LVGVLHAPPLRTVTSRPPLAAVAEQYTLPAPSLVQLGSELTVPAKLFHVPHFVPLNSLTMMTDLPLRTAHATCPAETGAQDGLPIPVAVPVEMKPPQVADAAGAISRQAENDSRHAAIFFIVSSLRWLGLCLWLRMGAEKNRRKYTTWSSGTALY